MTERAQSASAEEQATIIKAALAEASLAKRLTAHQIAHSLRMLREGAYLDAVLVMMPEGWSGSVPINRHCEAWIRKGSGPRILGDGATDALKLLAAIQKVHDA